MASPSKRLALAQSVFHALKCCIDDDPEIRQALLQHESVTEDIHGWLEEHLDKTLVAVPWGSTASIQKMKHYDRTSALVSSFCQVRIWEE
tara:strand:+ start:19776 stop:20045 length:270 start_codon:yes stop_codon:yes gene_type:complete